MNKKIYNLKNYMTRLGCGLDDLVIIDIERRKIIETEKMMSLDNDYIGHIEEFISYNIYVEYACLKNDELVKDAYVIRDLDLEEMKDIYVYLLTNFKSDLSFYNSE